jgi:hypothetical protein
MLMIFASDRIINGKQGESYHQQLRGEFSAFPPLPNATVIDSFDNFSPWNSHKALVGTTYRTDMPYAGIQEFYNRELQLRGWYLIEDRPVREWGKDYEGRTQTYCKGKLAASLQYRGSSGQGWTYAFEMSWGLHDCG